MRRKFAMAVITIILLLFIIPTVTAAETKNKVDSKVKTESEGQFIDPTGIIEVVDPDKIEVKTYENKWAYSNLTFFEKLVSNRTSVIIAIAVIIVVYLLISIIVVKRNNRKWKRRRK